MFDVRLGRRLLALLVALSAGSAMADWQADRLGSEKEEFIRLSREIKDWKDPKGPSWSFTSRQRLEKEALRSDALIQDSDRTPVDVILRRSAALLRDLSKAGGKGDWASAARDLAALEAENKAELSAAEQEALFGRVCQVRRQIALQNPRLNFKDILFLTHDPARRGDDHMVDQYLGFNATAGGSLYRLEGAMSDAPRAVDLLAGVKVAKGALAGAPLVNGSLISLELDYDAQTLAFAWTQANAKIPPGASYDDQPYSDKELFKYGHYHWRTDNAYHIFTMRVDGSQLTQLTDGPLNEYDPCFLPGGRIIFTSERSGNSQRCGRRWNGGATLHSMNPDGSDLIRLSYHETSEWQPSVANDGAILYTRWDYIDRDHNSGHHLWRCFPDGRDPRALHGNYAENLRDRPCMELGFRAIPGSSRLVASAVAHHGQNYGSLVLIDPSVPDDMKMSQVRRITPEAAFPETERHDRIFSTPWPLSEDYYLAVYSPSAKHYGLYLVDSFGNRLFLYQDPALSCLDPIPLQSRVRPPVLPNQTHQAAEDLQPGAPATSTVSVMNIYQSERPFPEGQKISALRIIQLFRKENALMNIPNIGSLQAAARGVLGTVPVEQDGSVHFELPPGIEVYFQALDPQGRAVQTMRSGAYTHPGESLTCVGCHESKYASPPTLAGATPLALKRPASKIRPDVSGSYPVSFPRLVQPVLEAKCLSCHDTGKTPPELSARRTPRPAGQPLNDYDRREEKRGIHFADYGWTAAYRSLQPYSWYFGGGGNLTPASDPISTPAFIGAPGGWTNTLPKGRREIQFSIPGQVGARASRLVALLDKGHHDVKLTAEELYRITLWQDCNSLYYGAFADPEGQMQGKRVLPASALNWPEAGQ